MESNIEDMRLTNITFTGVDAKTDLKALTEIQREYPIAEFGILTSYHWYENGNRYPDPRMIWSLTGGWNLALHVCGAAASDAAIGKWGAIDVHLGGMLDRFRRIQLNIAGRMDKPNYVRKPWYSFQEVIIQMKDYKDIEMYYDSMTHYNSTENFSVLMDPSGGRGIDAPLQICPYIGKIGYAGGINPENVGDKLRYLFENVEMGSFWIDMESGVRTDDWFDLNKVVRALETCTKVISEYQDKT